MGVVLLLAAGEASAGNGPRQDLPACEPDDPALDLLAELDGRAEDKDHDGKSDDPTSKAAAAVIRSYQRERAAHCRELGAAAIELEELRTQRDGWKDLYDRKAEDLELMRARWKDAVEKPAGTCSRSLLAFGPALSVDRAWAGEDRVDARVGLAVIIPLWTLGR